MPVRYKKNQRQGRHRRNELTTFDREAGEATWRSLLKKRIKKYAIKPDTRDILTFMYYMRSQNIKPQTVNTFEVMADEKLYNLEIHAGKIEKVKLKKYGEIPSLKMEPKAAFNGLMVRKGRMWVWVSRDDRRIATKIEAETPFANVRVLLDEIKGPGDDKWIIKNGGPKKKYDGPRKR